MRTKADATASFEELASAVLRCDAVSAKTRKWWSDKLAHMQIASIFAAHR